jgi:hypothetical protein
MDVHCGVEWFRWVRPTLMGGAAILCETDVVLCLMATNRMTASTFVPKYLTICLRTSLKTILLM